ncbi:MAG: hypothetical protein ACE5QF_08790 [Thermoplasmata archaeon]
MTMLNELRVDPLDYVERLESPIGVYLRREVFGRRKGDEAIRRDLREGIVSQQSSDGSWDQLFVHTANKLWDLALLGYGPKDPSVKRGLDWILTTQRHRYNNQPGFFYSSNRRDPSLMRETSYGEFGPGCTIFYQTAYAVHLFHILNLDNKKQVQQTVKSYLKFWTPDWCGAWCTVNILRILIEHPLSARSRRVQAGLKHFAERQTKTGAWKGYPFYHTFHALSRAEQKIAERQIENALPSVIRRQNRDGSWGKSNRETDTFLVLDALRNTGAF